MLVSKPSGWIGQPIQLNAGESQQHCAQASSLACVVTCPLDSEQASPSSVGLRVHRLLRSCRGSQVYSFLGLGARVTLGRYLQEAFFRAPCCIVSKSSSFLMNPFLASDFFLCLEISAVLCTSVYSGAMFHWQCLAGSWLDNPSIPMNWEMHEDRHLISSNETVVLRK